MKIPHIFKKYIFIGLCMIGWFILSHTMDGTVTDKFIIIGLASSIFLMAGLIRPFDGKDLEL